MTIDTAQILVCLDSAPARAAFEAAWSRLNVNWHRHNLTPSQMIEALTSGAVETNQIALIILDDRAGIEHLKSLLSLLEDRPTLTVLQLSDAVQMSQSERWSTIRTPRDPENFSELLKILMSRWSLTLEDRKRAKHLEDTNKRLQDAVDHGSRIYQEMEYRGLHDRLTGLPNRKLLLKHLKDGLSLSREGALMVIDLDRFKAINDSLGSHQGDNLLNHVARRLRTAVPPPGVLARIGADTFAAWIPGLKSVDESRLMAGHLQQALTAPVLLEQRPIYVSATIGLAPPRSDSDPVTLLRDAMLAMNRGKEHGRGTIEIFDDAMHASALERLQIESDLREAIDRSEFEIHYQPIVTLQDGRTREVEALVRWRHPERGLIAPDAFIPIAEETGLVIPLGDRVLEQVCRDLPRLGDKVGVNVNLSPVQFANDNLIETVGRILGHYGTPGDRIRFEITESAMTRNVDAAVDVLEQLRALNILLALDDFGTGYSSLSQLHLFPLDILKIDKSFIRRMGQGPKHGDLVSGILSIARGLNLWAVAEGVETPEQLARLRQLGCDFGQGYHLSHPLVIGDAPGYFESEPDR